MKRYIPALFWIAAFYDGVLGVAFLVAPLQTLQAVNVPANMHPGYIQFPAALLVVFAIMFTAIARQPALNRNLIPYGILLKVAYCSVVFWYWISSGLPFAWKPFAVADLCFAVLFWMAFQSLRTQSPAS